MPKALARRVMNPSSGEFKTTDLTLATYLHMLGLDYELVHDGERRNGYPVGAWIFAPNRVTPASVKLFQDGDAQVDPKAFHEQLNERREELFKFLDIGKKH
jgi:hypothetical protein